MTRSSFQRVFCPVCSARFAAEDGAEEGSLVRCVVCGQLLTLRADRDCWRGERHARLTDGEIRDRVDGFAELRGYTFNEMKEEIIDGLLAKRNAFGDFYCPCRLDHSADFQCPCKPTRSNDVDKHGKCHCGLFWRKT